MEPSTVERDKVYTMKPQNAHHLSNNISNQMHHQLWNEIYYYLLASVLSYELKHYLLCEIEAGLNETPAIE